jgi:hypothetical protein
MTSGKDISVYSNGDITLSSSCNIGGSSYKFANVYLYLDQDNTSPGTTATFNGSSSNTYIYADTGVYLDGKANTYLAVGNMVVYGNAATYIGKNTQSYSVTINSGLYNMNSGRDLEVYSNGNITLNTNIGSSGFGNVRFFLDQDNTGTGTFYGGSYYIYATTTVDPLAAVYLDAKSSTSLYINGMAVSGSVPINIGKNTPSASVTISGNIYNMTSGKDISVYSNGDITQSADIGSSGNKFANVYLYLDQDKSGTAAFTRTSGRIYAISTNICFASGNSTAFTLAGLSTDSGNNYGYTNVGYSALGTSDVYPASINITVDITIYAGSSYGNGLYIYSNGDITQNANITTHNNGSGWLYLYLDQDKSGAGTFTRTSGTIYAGSVRMLFASGNSTAFTLAGFNANSGSIPATVYFGDTYRPASVNITADVTTVGSNGYGVYVYSNGGITQQANIKANNGSSNAYL